MEGIEIVRRFYDGQPQQEWDRLAEHPVEFELNARFMARYIAPGQRVLDVGGGPGRYALHLSARGCAVTLADLSGGNVAFALDEARALGLPLDAVRVNALDLSRFGDASFDHVLLMGPLYHLTDGADRARAVREALRVLRPGGTLHASFIASHAGIVYCMKYAQALIMAPEEQVPVRRFVDDLDYSGMAFTHAYFIRPGDVGPFMAQFPLDPLHLFGSEGLMGPCEPLFMAQPKAVFDAWIDLSERVCERENLLCYAEHLQYVGRKRR